jgi:hypothetical protein
MELHAKESYRPHVEDMVSDLLSGINNQDEILIREVFTYELAPNPSTHQPRPQYESNP